MQQSRDNDAYIKDSSMVRMSEYFDDLATGRTQVPRQSVATRVREKIADVDVLAYHDLMVARSGSLFTHFLASVPGILEEMSRVGVALARLAQRQRRGRDAALSFFELDAFDGTNGRALASYADGCIETLTCSPNRANQVHFERFCDPARSRFIHASCLGIDLRTIGNRSDLRHFAGGFDFMYETAAFQFYGQERREQIDHVAQMLKSDGLIFFLEKLNHEDPDEYEHRERVKDELHKAQYFTQAEIEWKRTQMLTQMHDGQVTFDALVRAIFGRFNHVFMIWNSTNFYEFVASNDRAKLLEFLELLGPPALADEFCFDRPMVREVFPVR
jgi:hypothetical protein